MLRASFGLDQPTLIRLLAYLNNLAYFSLGYSPRYNTPVMDLIMSRLPGTLVLMLLSQIIAIATGVALGAVMAAWEGKWLDRLLSLAVLLLYSTPAFWIRPDGARGFFGLARLVAQRRQYHHRRGLAGLGLCEGFSTHAILPVTALAGFFVAIYTRLVRLEFQKLVYADVVSVEFGTDPQITIAAKKGKNYIPTGEGIRASFAEVSLEE
ncbi:hypothetical protein FACS189475_00960 [Betaproteobacteria bacterium]|nr:hypothetical protein FACS189475_00960 [Betaproteobacteria bacterium]